MRILFSPQLEGSPTIKFRYDISDDVGQITGFMEYEINLNSKNHVPFFAADLREKDIKNIMKFLESSLYRIKNINQ